jgi:dipeptidyl aminopeptidase/acylaminoacyl peptidase
MSNPEPGKWPLIPRKLLLGNASRLDPALSPDGRRLAWLAPVDGVMNLWVSPTEALAEAQPITRLGGRQPIWHDWSADGRFVIFARDENGDENHHFFAVESGGGEVRDLTPLPKISARLFLRSRDLPERVLLGLNDRDPRWHDVWSVDLASGARELVYENKEEFAWFLPDWQGHIRLAGRSNPVNGGHQIYRFEDGRPEPWRLTPFDDFFGTDFYFFDRTGSYLFGASSIGRDKSALIRIDMKTMAETILAEHPKADLVDAIWNPETFEIDAVAASLIRKEWIILNPEVGETLSLVRHHAPDDEIQRLSASHDNRRWIVALYGPKRPATYCLVDRDKAAVTELFGARPDLKPYRLSGMDGVVIKSRDGLDLVSYVTLPPDEPDKRPRAPLPMVLMVHGGPWGRDDYGYRRDHQWLVNRGYAAMSVNYRASTGFGKSFVNAGDGEHAAKIHDDLIDAVEWAIKQGVAQRDKIAIIGWSYGGYASFIGATFTPDVFCCSIPVVGITDLITLLESTPPYWADFMDQFYRRYGDPRTEEGRALLRSRSPLYKADQIKKPMLIAHGANDVRCTLAQSNEIVAAMQRLGLPVTYVVFPDEGHGFRRPENNIAFHAVAEAFLAKHLGGRAEPIGEDFEGSTIEIRAGGEILPPTSLRGA